MGEVLPLPPTQLLYKLHPERGEETLPLRGEHNTSADYSIQTIVIDFMVSHCFTYLAVRKQRSRKQQVIAAGNNALQLSQIDHSLA